MVETYLSRVETLLRELIAMKKVSVDDLQTANHSIQLKSSKKTIPPPVVEQLPLPPNMSFQRISQLPEFKRKAYFAWKINDQRDVLDDINKQMLGQSPCSSGSSCSPKLQDNPSTSAIITSTATSAP